MTAGNVEEGEGPTLLETVKVVDVDKAPDSHQALKRTAIHQPNPPTGHHFSAEETVLIFDWDDTMLPSSWVHDQGLRTDASGISESQRKELQELADLAANTLHVAKQYGTVVLVTNAEQGWIESSCKTFLPSLVATLEDVKLLSARSAFESAAFRSPIEWKRLAFKSELYRIFESCDNGRKNVISMGDSAYERQALIEATANLSNCRTKSLKFVDRPGLEQLRKQHLLVARNFEKIVQHDGNLDLCIRSKE